MQKLILILIFVLGLFFTFFVPPFQKPDEYTHFRKAVAISNGNLCLGKNIKTFYYQKYFLKLEEKINSFRLIHNPAPHFGYNIYLVNAFASPGDLIPIKMKSNVLCLIPTFPFIPQAVALKIITGLGFNQYISFFSGRLIIYLICFFWFLYLFKKTPGDFKYFLLFTFSLPMTLHQITSYGYDAIHIMLGLSLFVCFLKLLGSKRINIKELTAVFTLVLVFILSKEGFYSFFILPLIIPYKLIDRDIPSYFKKMVVFYLTFFILFLFFRFNYFSQIFSYVKLQPPSTDVNAGLQINYLLKNPLNIFRLFVNTIFARSDFYLRSTIGELGWLEYSLNLYVYVFFVAIASVIMHSAKLPLKIKFRKQTLFFLGFLLLTSYLYFFIYFYLAWSKVGSRVVEGIQGRYFITFIPFLFLFLVYLKKYPNLIKVLKILILLFIFFSIILTVLRRYYI